MDTWVQGCHKVSQKDSLVPSEAILTVGLESSPAQQDIGVYWSLPLAHYRFYGPPKSAEHSLCTDAERLSLEQFGQVALGCFLWGWSYDSCEIVDYVKLLVRVYEFLTADRGTEGLNRVHDIQHDTSMSSDLGFLKSKPTWLKYLTESGRLLLQSDEPNRAVHDRLIRLGMRRGRKFIDQQPPLLGLGSFHDLFAMMKTTEHKIQALRRLAERLNITAHNALIRYKDPNYNDEGGSRNLNNSNPGPYSYASVTLPKKSSARRSYVRTEIKPPVHKRWVSLDDGKDYLDYQIDEEILGLNQLDILHSTTREVELAGGRTLRLMVGDPEECALFAEFPSWSLYTTLDDITWALELGALDPAKLANFLCIDAHPSQEPITKTYLMAWRALATIFDIYGQFSRVTVALKVIESPLLQQQWVTAWRPEWKLAPSGSDNVDHRSQPKGGLAYAEQEPFAGLCPLTLSRGETFALLAAFETGYLDPHPSTLSLVMAMSAGDSIFVATQMLTDPLDSQSLKPSSITRIRGNIGKPGVVMLVSPPELQVKRRNSANWAVINHASFDGELVDSLEGTSLHLSFSEYNRAIDHGVHGGRDAEIYFSEAYVQVYSKGQWIGDADITSGLESTCLRIFDHDNGAKTPCRHRDKHIRTFRLVSIDNWDEFVDNPPGGIIIRAKDNWLARLAATTLSVQRGNRTIVLRSNSSICWQCVRNHFVIGSAKENYALVC